MIRLRAPRAEELDRQIAHGRGAPLSYRPAALGATLTGEVPEDYAAGEWEIALGHGAERFGAAREALRSWRHFPAELVAIHPADAPPEPGAVVALRCRAGPFHAALACRVVLAVDDERGEGAERVRRTGFAYGTIEGHVERGEELFLIEHRAEDDAVTYRIRAISRPAHPLAWLAQPWIRALQRRFGRLSAAALRRACGAPADLPPPREVLRRPACGLPWIGAVAFALVILALRPPLSAALLALAPLVVLPAARALLPAGWLRSERAAVVWFASALLLAIAPAYGTGAAAATCAAPWFLATVAMALRAAASLGAGAPRAPADSATLVGFLLLPVGSVWALFHHLGRWPGGYPAPLPELTALHFHYAGFVAPLILGRAVAAAAPRAVPAAAALWFAGMAAVALGITLSPALEVASALALIAFAGTIAGLQIRAALRTRSLLGGSLLAIGGLALLAGLGLAATYAVAEASGAARGLAPYTGGGLLPWERMVPYHGAAMALGCLASVIGWDAAREWAEPPRAAAPG